MGDVLQMVLWYVTFLFSVTFHEAAHAWAALKGGDSTAYHGGQVTLDPIPHIRREPLGMVALPVLSLLFGSHWPIGFASTPFDALWAARNEKRAALMSLAGPAANLLLVVVAGLAIWGGILGKVLVNPDQIRTADACIVEAIEPGAWSAVATLLSMFFVLNLGLTVLNLIPLPPLDGSGAMPLLLGGRALAAYRDFASNPHMSVVGLLAAWYLFAPIFGVVLDGAIRVLYPWARYG